MGLGENEGDVEREAGEDVQELWEVLRLGDSRVGAEAGGTGECRFSSCFGEA